MDPDSQTSWQDSLETFPYPTLSSSILTDVVIIGGGLTGILTAYILSKQGKKVVVIDQGTIGGGATAQTSAFLTQIIDTDYREIISWWDKETATLISQSHGKSIDLIEKIILEEKIDCEFKRCSNFIFANEKNDRKALEKERTAHKQVGIEAKNILDVGLGLKHYGYTEVTNQAKFHPLKFLHQLAKKAVENGAKIFEHTKALEIVDGEKVVNYKGVVTDKGTIEASWIIVSTYEPFNRPLGLYLKKSFYTSYMYEIEVPKDSLSEGIYEDTANPYHYFRVDKMKDYDRVLIGGEDHRSDIQIDEGKNFEALFDYVNKIFEGIPCKITKKWKGPIVEPFDGLPYIGPYHYPNTLYALGFSGNGMTYAGIAASIFSDLIDGKENEWLSLYNAKRFPYLKLLPQKGIDYIGELIGGALKNSILYSKVFGKKKQK